MLLLVAQSWVLVSAPALGLLVHVLPLGLVASHHARQVMKVWPAPHDVSLCQHLSRHGMLRYHKQGWQPHTYICLGQHDRGRLLWSLVALVPTLLSSQPHTAAMLRQQPLPCLTRSVW